MNRPGASPSDMWSQYQKTIEEIDRLTSSNRENKSNAPSHSKTGTQGRNSKKRRDCK